MLNTVRLWYMKRVFFCMGFLIDNTRLTDTIRQWVLRSLMRQFLWLSDSKDCGKNKSFVF